MQDLSPDAELVASALRGDPDAFARLMARFERGVRDEADALRARLTRNGAEIVLEEKLGDEWHTLIRFTAEAKLHIEGKPLKRHGTPIEQPLWQPVRAQFAASCGIQPRDGAPRQTACLHYSLDGEARDLPVVFTPKTITV